MRSLWLACALGLASAWAGAGESPLVVAPPVFVLRIDGAIGPVTADTARAAGLPVDALAKEATMTGLADALDEYFAGRRPLC